MTDTDRDEKLRNFFSEEGVPDFKQTSYTKIGYVFLVAGIIIFYLSIAGYTGNYFLLGLAFFILGLFLIRKKLSGLFSFRENEIQNKEELKQLFLNDINENVLSEAFSELNIKSSVVRDDNIFIFKVPVYEKIPGIDDEKILRKQFEEGDFVYSVWEIHVLIASQNFVSSYSCVYNWLTNSCINALTNEFYYSDIASVKSEFSEEEVNYLGEGEAKKEYLKTIIISNISGDKMKFIIEIPSLQLAAEFQEKNDDVVKEMRLLFRKKRFPDDNSFSGDDVDFEIEDTRTSDDLN